MHKAKTSTAQRLGRGLWACTVGLVALSFGACASESAEEDSAPLGQQLMDGGIVATDAGAVDAGLGEAVFSSTVTATGSGCPEGTWRANISSDKRDYVFSFDDYKVAVGADVASDVKECRLTIKLQGQSGLSFAVSNYAHNGVATLAEGVQGKQTSTWYFFGANVTARLRSTLLTGPRGGSYGLGSTLVGDEVFWTPCALQRDLILISRIQLHNGGSGAIGSASSYNTRHTPGIGIGLVARRCNMPTPPAPR